LIRVTKPFEFGEIIISTKTISRQFKNKNYQKLAGQAKPGIRWRIARSSGENN